MRSGLNSTEPSAAVNAERVITRAVESPLVRGGLMIVAGVLTGKYTNRDGTPRKSTGERARLENPMMADWKNETGTGRMKPGRS